MSYIDSLMIWICHLEHSSNDGLVLNVPLLESIILKQCRTIHKKWEMDMKKLMEASRPCDVISSIEDHSWALKVVDGCISQRIHRRGSQLKDWTKRSGQKRSRQKTWWRILVHQSIEPRASLAQQWRNGTSVEEGPTMHKKHLCVEEGATL